MKRYLLLMCMGCCTATFAVACGDDDGGGGNGTEDGGVTVDDKLNDITDQLGGLDDDLAGLGTKVDDGLADLNTKLEGASGDIGGLQGDVGDLQSQLEDLITPDSCSVEELCVPDGVEITAAAMASLVTALCEKEFNCCDDNERATRLGAGVKDVGDCVKRFVDMLENGQSPNLNLYWANDAILSNAVDIAAAINSSDVQVGIDADAITACADSIKDIDCNEESDAEEPEDHCETIDYTDEDDPCSPDAIVIGLQQEGEVCGVAEVNVCAAGLHCSNGELDLLAPGSGHLGICMPPSAVDDACATDSNCTGEEQYCDPETNTCAERGDAGDPCEYVDPTFTVTTIGNLSPQWYGGWVQNPSALNIECKTNLFCDPIEEKCVDNCSEHALCSNNMGCPEDMVCNFTEVDHLKSSWGFGLCTDPIENGDPCTPQSSLPNGESVSPECDSERCADIGGDNGAECVDARTEDGGDCDGDVVAIAPAMDSTCASNWCDGSEQCATLCQEQADCDDDFYCNMFGPQPIGGGWYACEPQGDTGDTCVAMTDGEDLGTDITCASGRCDTGTGLCAAKLALAATCTHNADCPSGDFCGYDTTDTPAPGYECMVFVATSADCNTPAAGDWGCGPDANCIAGVCVDAAEDGDACDGEVGPYCQGDLTCAINPTDDDECHFGGDFPNGFGCEESCADNEDGDSVCENDLCASGFCNTNNTGLCEDPIESGEDCDADDPESWHCEDGYYCKHDPDADEEDMGKGKCTEQRATGEGCEPRYDTYGGGLLNVHDCQGEDDTYYPSNNCGLYGGEFLCGAGSYDDDTLMCDGT